MPTQSGTGVYSDTFGIIGGGPRVYTYVTFGKPRPKHMTANNSKETLVMAFARLRAHFQSAGHRSLYSKIARIPSQSQRDELLIMAQRAESR